MATHWQKRRLLRIINADRKFESGQQHRKNINRKYRALTDHQAVFTSLEFSNVVFLIFLWFQTIKEQKHERN
jgi:hypothetical protein